MNSSQRNRYYAILNSILANEYGVPVPAKGMLVVLSEDMPDGDGYVFQLSNEEMVELSSLMREWEGLEKFMQSKAAFLIGGVFSTGHRVLVWGVRKGEELVLQGWVGWLNGQRLSFSTASRAAQFAHKSIEEMMKQGLVRAFEAPLHFGWREEALDSVQFCALSALESNLAFPDADVEALIKSRIGARGFGFAIRDQQLIWVVVEESAGGFTLVAFGYQDAESSQGTLVNRIQA